MVPLLEPKMVPNLGPNLGPPLTKKYKGTSFGSKFWNQFWFQNLEPRVRTSLSQNLFFFFRIFFSDASEDLIFDFMWQEVRSMRQNAYFQIPFFL